MFEFVACGGRGETTIAPQVIAPDKQGVALRHGGWRAKVITIVRKG